MTTYPITVRTRLESIYGMSQWSHKGSIRIDAQVFILGNQMERLEKTKVFSRGRSDFEY